MKCKALFRQQSSVLSEREKAEENLGRNGLTQGERGQEREDIGSERLKGRWGDLMSRHPPGP